MWQRLKRMRSYMEQMQWKSSAPGRSEIGGNHTDHQHGEVLATSINLDAIAIVKKLPDMQIVLYRMAMMRS